MNKVPGDEDDIISYNLTATLQFEGTKRSNSLTGAGTTFEYTKTGGSLFG